MTRFDDFDRLARLLWEGSERVHELLGSIIATSVRGETARAKIQVADEAIAEIDCAIQRMRVLADECESASRPLRVVPNDSSVAEEPLPISRLPMPGDRVYPPEGA